jgi:hypothetical protein
MKRALQSTRAFLKRRLERNGSDTVVTICEFHSSMLKRESLSLASLP